MASDEKPFDDAPPPGDDRFREAPKRGLVPAPPAEESFAEPEADIRRVRSKVRPEDEQYLNLLSIFHYVVGGLAFLCYSVPIIYLALGIAMVSGAMPGPAPPPATQAAAQPGPDGAPGKNPPPPVARPAPGQPVAMGWMFIAIGSVSIVFGWTFAAALCLAGWMLRRHKRYLFCMIMAGVACLFQPFGTILGVFTIIVLLRPGVKELFGRGTTQPAAS